MLGGVSPLRIVSMPLATISHNINRSMLTFRSVNAFKVLDNVVSSAYMIKLIILVALGKSLMYRTNNNGPKIDP